jgi:NAD(P)-dependent dehydrogenase (short-subunit alcohol dehydrogenase family)
MAKIFITGSADGLGLLAAKKLIDEGNRVVLHARNAERGQQVLKKLPGAENVLIADLSDIEAIKKLALEVNDLGSFDTIIHNAGVYQASGKQIFEVNVLAPYILTCLIQKPKRLIYIGSGMHLQGNSTLNNLTDGISYANSKLYVLALSMAVARKWRGTFSNTVNPGWVATKMGGTGAPDNIDKGAETQAWLAVSKDSKAEVSGRYFYHKKEEHYRLEASDIIFQDKLLALCEQISGVSFPTH